MSSIEHIISQAVRLSVNEAVKPLASEIKELREAIALQSKATRPPFVQLKVLATELGCSLSKLKRFKANHSSAPKANPMGLYDVVEWREYLKETPL